MRGRRPECSSTDSGGVGDAVSHLVFQVRGTMCISLPRRSPALLPSTLLTDSS